MLSLLLVFIIISAFVVDVVVVVVVAYCGKGVNRGSGDGYSLWVLFGDSVERDSWTKLMNRYLAKIES